MSLLGPTILIYVLIGIGVAVAVYISDANRPTAGRAFGVLTAIPFWPVYVPLLLAPAESVEVKDTRISLPASEDEMSFAIHRVDKELEEALNSLDGWAEGVLAREKSRIHELRHAWTFQSDRIRAMDRLLTQENGAGPILKATPSQTISANAQDRLQHSQEVRRQNLERLRQVRRRAYEDLMGTLAWVRELVSMIHLAKFTGAPASRAEELVAQIAAAVEGLFQLFVETVPERWSKIESALGRQDRYALQQESRRLAAAAERIAAGDVGAAARRIETVAPHEDFERLGEDLRGLAVAIESLRAGATALAGASVG